MKDSIPAPFWMLWAACLWLALFLTCVPRTDGGGSLEDLLDSIFLVDFSEGRDPASPSGTSLVTMDPSGWMERRDDFETNATHGTDSDETAYLASLP